MIRLLRFTQILALTACCGWGLAQAQGLQAEGTQARGPIDQDWQFSLGTFLVTSDTKLKVDGETIEGSDVNWGKHVRPQRQGSIQARRVLALCRTPQAPM